MGMPKRERMLKSKLPDSRAGQIVLLSGEAGIGKSRLAAQLIAEIASESHTRLRYQCSPFPFFLPKGE